MIGPCLRIEVAKLRGSLAPWFVFAAPLAIGLLCAAAVLGAQDTQSWPTLVGQLAYPLWALFLLPMSVTVFTALYAQIEHGAGGWRHIQVQPVSWTAVHAAKLSVVFGAVVAMTLLLPLFAVVGGALGSLLSGKDVSGRLEPTPLILTTVRLTVAAIPVVAIQHVAALRFRSFVPPVLIGMAGTVAALAIQATASDAALWFPYTLSYVALGAADGPLGLLLGHSGAVVLVWCGAYALLSILSFFVLGAVGHRSRHIARLG